MTRSVNGRQRALRCYHELTRFFVYRIPDAPYSVPYVPPIVTVGSMGHLGRMGHDG